MGGVDVKMLDRLYEPTPDAEIRVKPATTKRPAMSYVDARYVMRKLDELGPENWQRRHSIGADGKVSCDIGIKVEDEWVWKGDGAGETDIEGSKGSFSDAFKRAAVNWGIARDLYSHRAGASSPARPALSPAAGPSPGLAAGGEPPWPGEASGAAECPIHHKPWRTNQRGYYCATKVGDGWCQESPSKAWSARQEMSA